MNTHHWNNARSSHFKYNVNSIIWNSVVFQFFPIYFPQNCFFIISLYCTIQIYRCAFARGELILKTVCQSFSVLLVFPVVVIAPLYICFWMCSFWIYGNNQFRLYLFRFVLHLSPTIMPSNLLTSCPLFVAYAASCAYQFHHQCLLFWFWLSNFLWFYAMKRDIFIRNIKWGSHSMSSTILSVGVKNKFGVEMQLFLLLVQSIVIVIRHSCSSKLINRMLEIKWILRRNSPSLKNHTLIFFVCIVRFNVARNAEM